MCAVLASNIGQDFLSCSNHSPLGVQQFPACKRFCDTQQPPSLRLQTNCPNLALSKYTFWDVAMGALEQARVRLRVSGGKSRRTRRANATKTRKGIEMGGPIALQAEAWKPTKGDWGREPVFCHTVYRYPNN